MFLCAADAPRAPTGLATLVTPTPQSAWARAATALHRPRETDDGGAPATLEPRMRLGPGVVLGEDVRIGEGSEIGAHAVIGPGVQIGRHCRIGPHAVIGFSLIGDRVRIAAGAVIGEAGFGVSGDAGGLIDLPQLGRVIVQDGVSIGANSCVDRGAYGDTMIGENSKIDNLVQIAHNVRLGRNCVLAGAHRGFPAACGWAMA